MAGGGLLLVSVGLFVYGAVRSACLGGVEGPTIQLVCHDHTAAHWYGGLMILALLVAISGVAAAVSRRSWKPLLLTLPLSWAASIALLIWGLHQVSAYPT